jgi:hypothetical protein
MGRGRFVAGRSSAFVVLSEGERNLMNRKTHQCVVLVYGILALAGIFAGRSAGADDKKAALSGEWVRKEGEIKIEFDGEGVMKLFPHGANNKLAIVFDYTVEKDKRVKVKMTDLEGEEKVIEKVKEHIPAGLAFSFKWTVKDKTATLDDIKGKEDVIGHLEMLKGEYEMK